MQKVIFQLEGIGAFRVAADRLPSVRALAELPAAQGGYAGRDFYLVDGCGRTWAPLPNDEWALWN